MPPYQMESIDAVILCGGLGTRLRPVFADRPKCLALINGIPFLEILINHLKGHGIRRFILCTGHLGGQIEEVFGPAIHSGEIVISRENTPLGTGGALRLALPLVRSSCFLALNGDSFLNLPVRQMLSAHQSNPPKAATLALVTVSDGQHFGCVEINSCGEVISFNEKPIEKKHGLINGGVYVIEKKSFGKFAAPFGHFSLEKQFFPKIVGRGLYGFPVQQNGTFIDIGTPENYGKAPNVLASLLKESSGK